jgi:hypothetical protein
MDDGSLQNKGLHFYTYGFTSQDILNLKFTLENMFGEKYFEMFNPQTTKKDKKIWVESM